MITRLAGHACLILAVALCCAGQASAVALPPELVAALQEDRREAERDLAAQRRLLARAAEQQRAARARMTRLVDRQRVLVDVAALIGAELPTGIARPVVAAVRQASRDDSAAQGALERQTEATAQIQADALDADRRLRALQRASATEDQRDTTLGSWRFGSGGPSVSAASIDEYLASKGSPLAGQGAAFLESGVEHEVDPRLVVAIAGAESYFGITLCASHNAWGWGCPTSPYRFRDWPEAIDTVTLGLRDGYLDDGLTTVGEIHLRYAPPNAANDPTNLNYAWPDNVARFLVEQGGDPEDVEGVLGPSR